MKPRSALPNPKAAWRLLVLDTRRESGQSYFLAAGPKATGSLGVVVVLSQFPNSPSLD